MIRGKLSCSYVTELRSIRNARKKKKFKATESFGGAVKFNSH